MYKYKFVTSRRKKQAWQYVVVFQGKEITVRLDLLSEHLYVFSVYVITQQKRVYDILQQFFSEMLFREKEALFYDRRVILYSVQVFGSLGRNGVKNTCTAILGVFFIDFNPGIGLITVVIMVVDDTSVHSISSVLLV